MTWHRIPSSPPRTKLKVCMFGKECHIPQDPRSASRNSSKSPQHGTANCQRSTRARVDASSINYAKHSSSCSPAATASNSFEASFTKTVKSSGTKKIPLISAAENWPTIWDSMCALSARDWDKSSPSSPRLKSEITFCFLFCRGIKPNTLLSIILPANGSTNFVLQSLLTTNCF